MNISKRVLANLVVFLVVFGVMIVWAIQNVVTVDAINKPYEITGEFGAASGVAANAEVAYLGVHIGRVSAVELCSPITEDPCTDNGVRVTMLIDRDRDIPVGSVARVFRKSAIGEPYIDFQPPVAFDPATAHDDDYIRPGDGDEVAVADTRTPLEFSELLRTFSDLLENVEPSEAGIVVHELALALDGRAEDLRRLTIAGDQLASTFAERTDVLDRLAVNNTRLTQVLADHRESLGSSITDLSLLAESLRNASGDTTVLLDRGTALLAEVGDLLDDSRPNIDCLLDDLVDVNATAGDPEQLAGLVHLLENGPRAFDLFWTTRDNDPGGVWVRVNLTFGPENPADQYVPPRVLPGVPAIPACAGVVAAGNGTAVPATDFR
ncbi:MAG: MCE family protein, partial [Acidimicrobiia bacterium]|nr:MCE family protein [Acidimicrobiia bacterium]